jgi:hypothetical protein
VRAYRNINIRKFSKQRADECRSSMSECCLVDLELAVVVEGVDRVLNRGDGNRLPGGGFVGCDDDGVAVDTEDPVLVMVGEGADWPAGQANQQLACVAHRRMVLHGCLPPKRGAPRLEGDLSRGARAWVREAAGGALDAAGVLLGDGCVFGVGRSFARPVNSRLLRAGRASTAAAGEGNGGNLVP